MTEHDSFNRAIRAATGRVDTPERDAPVKEGSIGIGRGAGAAPAPLMSSSAQLNDRLRAGMRVARGFTVPGGVRLDDVDLDDLYR